jgi:hypothetical protein
MNIDTIISQLDSEISRLTQAKALLMTGSKSTVPPAPDAKRSVGRPKKTTKSATSPKVLHKRRPMSAEGKAKIVAAQKKRWAKVLREAKAELVAAE